MTPAQEPVPSSMTATIQTGYGDVDVYREAVVPVPRPGPGQVLVHSAAGCVGSFVVQIAKAHGARVVAVDLPAKLDLLRSQGADEAIDGTMTDPTVGESRYDLVFDVLGLHPLRAWCRVLKPAGHYVLIGHDQYGASHRTLLGGIPQMLALALRAPFVSQKVVFGPVKLSEPPLEMLAGWLAEGAITPRIDSVVPLSELPDAMRRLERNETQGRIVFAP